MSWPLVPLSDAALIQMGTAPPGSSYNEASEGVPMIAGAGDYGEKYPLPKKWTTQPTRMTNEGDLIVCVRATIGDLNWADKKYCLGRGVAGVRAKRNVADLGYLAHVIASKKRELTKLGTGSTFLAIRRDDLKGLQIPLPPLKEQKRIAAILDKADAIRRKRQQAIELADQFLRSVFLDMFGDPLANPKGWKVKTLQDLSSKISSGTTPIGGSKVYVDEGVAFLRSQNVWRNKIVTDDLVYIDSATHSKMHKSSLKNKDLLMTKTGRFNTENSSLGRAAIFLGEDDTANINGHVYLMRLQDNVVHEFVLFILTTNEYREYIRSVCVGGIDKRQINKDHLQHFPIICPPLDIQHQFSEITRAIGAQNNLAKKSLKEFEDLFDSLSQKVFKGEALSVEAA